jgi:hypothetical protein
MALLAENWRLLRGAAAHLWWAYYKVAKRREGPPTSYKAAGGSIEQTESQKDADLEAVRRLFETLRRFTTEDAPGFQLIVTEHANLREDWFQAALVEDPWTKPPALVPDDWLDIPLD